MVYSTKIQEGILFVKFSGSCPMSDFTLSAEQSFELVQKHNIKPVITDLREAECPDTNTPEFVKHNMEQPKYYLPKSRVGVVVNPDQFGSDAIEFVTETFENQGHSFKMLTNMEKAIQ